MVISVATPVFALHVSDRLVSKQGKPYDALANKTVVFRATDGLLALGYTGPAFLDGLPTDVWIAEVLSGTECGGDVGAVRYGRFPVRDTGSSLLALCARLRARREFERFGGEINAVGWQWSGKRENALVRHVLWVLHSGSGVLRWEQIVPRQRTEGKKAFRIVATGDWPLGPARWNELVGAVGGFGADWEAVQGLLLAAVREASEARPGTIGKHCLAVLLRPWLTPAARVEFFPAASHVGFAFEQTVDLAYTPWLISADAVLAPSVLVGGLECDQGALSYSIDAPQVPREQALKAVWQSQARPTR